MDITRKLIEPFASVMYASINIGVGRTAMKSELWNKVKKGDYLIYADEDDGVQKVKVIEIDITIETFDPEYKKEQPYGLTAETGNLKIMWTVDEATHTLIENLANLIRFNNIWYSQLKRAYDEWQDKKAEAADYKETFISKRAEYRLL